jgi:ketosteroid isomerase-like protein
MSSENLDLVRSIYADWEHGDFSRADWADPEIEYVIADGPDPVSATGLENVPAAWRGVMSGWDELRAEADEYRRLDDERVLVLFRRGGRGKRSALEVAQIGSKGAQLFHLRDGRVTTLVWYWDRDRAFADLGLEG